ncbi:MAG: hypothetical protein AAB386_02015 [Patescibacteria group bacterium]
MRKYLQFSNIFAWLVIILIISATGTGCAKTTLTEEKQLSKETNWTHWKEGKKGLALLNTANIQTGSSITFTDAEVSRSFTSVLPPTFTDQNGKYPGPKDGESVEVQLGVGGTVKRDREMFGELERLTDFEDGNIESWIATAAFDTLQNRWVVRATYPDPTSDEAYTVIECLSATDSDKSFWDGCRTMIEKAKLSFPTKTVE